MLFIPLYRWHAVWGVEQNSGDQLLVAPPSRQPPPTPPPDGCLDRKKVFKLITLRAHVAGGNLKEFGFPRALLTGRAFQASRGRAVVCRGAEECRSGRSGVPLPTPRSTLSSAHNAIIGDPSTASRDWLVCLSSPCGA